jgi:hypothetical protein
MDKRPLIVVSLCAVVLLVMSSLSNVVGYQLVKSTTVNNSLLFQPWTQKVKMVTKEIKLKNIVEDMNEKISNSASKEECKYVFQESLIELERQGFLGKSHANDVYQILNDSYSSGNSYTVYGKSTQTLFLERLGVFFYELSKKSKDHLGLFLSTLFLSNRNHLIHMGSYITFGTLYYFEITMYDADPAEGYVKIVGPNGETEYNDSFFGQLEKMDQLSLGDPDISVVHCIGIKGFIGILIGNYYFGTAKEVGIGVNVPNSW